MAHSPRAHNYADKQKESKAALHFARSGFELLDADVFG